MIHSAEVGNKGYNPSWCFFGGALAA